jgi:serine/threonine protein kinase/tetratricopeptide (TPR) repeat protein
MNSGERYGEYDIIRPLGQGSMGVVYLALRRDTGQQVALKVVAFTNPDSQEHIEAEKRGAQLQQQIAQEDSRVVVVNRILFHELDLNVEMEYVEGSDLFDLIKQGALRPREAAEMAADLCEMLCNLGNKTPPVVHADLKPRNVRVRPDKRVKVMDFGIAKEMMRGDGTVNLFQTVRYASPERLLTTVASKESDLWSLGVMLYEMVTGRHPFQASGEEMRLRILSDRGPDPLPDNVPAPLRNIICHALARPIEQRYPGADKMLVDLRRYLAGLPVLAPEPVVAPHDDNDATRRTADPSRSTETIRTPPFLPPDALPPQPARSRFPTIWDRHPRARRITVICVAIAVVLGSLAQMHAWADAGKLRQQIEHNEIDPTEAWTRYQSVEKEAPAGFLLFGLNASLKRQLVAAAEEPILDYRSESPAAREGDWQRAIVSLERAHDLDPADKNVMADLHVCEGHLKRIQSVTGKNRRTVNRMELNGAIEDFQEAAKLQPKSPDPYLGLAQIYFYYLHDPQKGEQMIDEAQRRGHSGGKRESIERADGLRDRGIRADLQAQGFAGMPDQEKQFLVNARDDYQAAIEAYSQLSDFNPSVPGLLKDTYRRKKSVEERLDQLNENQVMP